MSVPRSMNELDTPVEFFLESRSVDEAGAPVSAWSVLAFPRTYAKEQAGSTSEGEVADQEASFSRVVFWIRFRYGISNTMRLRRNGQWFDVVSADAIGRRQWLRVVCEKINDG